MPWPAHGLPVGQRDEGGRLRLRLWDLDTSDPWTTRGWGPYHPSPPQSKVHEWLYSRPSVSAVPHPQSVQSCRIYSGGKPAFKWTRQLKPVLFKGPLSAGTRAQASQKWKVEHRRPSSLSIAARWGFLFAGISLFSRGPVDMHIPFSRPQTYCNPCASVWAGAGLHVRLHENDPLKWPS